MTTRRGQLAMLLALVITAAWMFVASPARALMAADASQSAHPPLAQTQLEDVDRTDSHPSGGEGEFTLVVDRFDFSGAWLEVQRSAVRHGGSVLSATAESLETDGRMVSVAVAELRLPAAGLGETLRDLLALGALAEGRFTGDGGAVVDLTVTVTDAAEVTAPVSGSDSMLGRSLDTAGNVVLNIAGIAIIVAAAVVPIGLFVLLGYAIYRWARSQFDSPDAIQDTEVVGRGDTRGEAVVE